jgi:hypothetical protein
MLNTKLELRSTSSGVSMYVRTRERVIAPEIEGPRTIIAPVDRQVARRNAIDSLTELIAELRGLLKDLRLDTKVTIGVCVTLGIVYLAAHMHGRKILFVLEESELARLVYCRVTAGEPVSLCGPTGKVEPDRSGPPPPPPPVVSPAGDRTSLISRPVTGVKVRDYGPRPAEAFYVASGMAVQPGDVLHIRERPSPLGRTIGSIAPEGAKVIATGPRHRRLSGMVWIEVRHPAYGVGWVNVRYVRRVN